ncbi:ATP-binding protein [Vibrio parahaemolyticus]|uniref:ATP-binding protein n=1 Tax=Vibrio parahaemolyticus TaxID=670 RepID=UPI00235F7B75|nr:ATP-binding protein [Vibrio parahaemolyticus]
MYTTISKFLLLMFLFFQAGISFATPDLNKEKRPLFELNSEEKRWIELNPIVTYAFPSSWPVDFTQNNEHVGLSRDYLDVISELTGITFIAISSDNTDSQQVDLISAASHRLTETDDRWLLTVPYINVTSAIVSQRNTPTIYSIQQLYGHKVGILENSFYERLISERHPKITLVRYENALKAIEAVNKREVYAAIGTELTMRPLLQRYFPSELSITGALESSSSGISMAVISSKPKLLSIINKSLQSLTAEQTQGIFERWGYSLKLGVPPVSSILYYYKDEFIVFGIFTLILLVAFYQVWISRRRARASERDKARFLAVMSHEIRTPLNALMASLELLKKSKSQKEETDYLNLACNSAHNLMDLLNDILDYSRLDSKQMIIHKELVEFKPLLHSIYETHRASAVNKGLALSIEDSGISDGFCTVIDSQRTRQILHNLVSNAIKFSESGEVKIIAEVQLQPHLNSKLMVHVIDEGIGIDKEAQARLFKAWQQVGRLGNNRQGGSGLGLYISSQFAQLMGGELSIRSEIGEGTCVSLSLPLEVKSFSNDFPSKAYPKQVTFNEETSVLIVEDHPINQRLMREQLQSLGCHVETADCGEDAIKLIEDENYYSVILLDCHLPGCSGYDVSRFIRKHEERYDLVRTPIIAISAMSEKEHIARCYESGMDDLLCKPIQTESLITILNKWSFDNIEQSTTKNLEVYNLSDNERIHLRADLKSLEIAFKNGDVKHQLYYAHRIHGVALMLEMGELTKLTSQLENKLRNGSFFSFESGQAICAELKRHINSN